MNSLKWKFWAGGSIMALFRGAGSLSWKETEGCPSKLK